MPAFKTQDPVRMRSKGCLNLIFLVKILSYSFAWHLRSLHYISQLNVNLQLSQML